MPRQTISELVVIVGSDVEEALSGLNRIGMSAQRFGRDLERTGRTLTTRVTAPILGVGAAGFKMASDLETSFARMEGLVGVQRSQLDAWEGQVRGLAVTYGISATEAADALFFITSAGLEGSDAMDALEQSLKASASGLGDTATIADLTTSAMNAYGADVLSAAQATDVLTAAVREGKLEPEQLAGSMGRVIPIASEMGIGFDQVGAAMAAMSRTGTQADEAATQLRGIMAALIKPTAEAESALAGMGLSASGLREQVSEQGLLSVLQTLSERFRENDEGVAAVFGNVRALTGVMSLMGENSAATSEIFASLTDSTGSLDSAFSAMSDTAGFNLNQALAASKDLLIEIGNAVLPPATEALKNLTAAVQPVVEWFSNLDPKAKQVGVVVAGVAAAIGPLLLALGAIVTGGGAVITAVTAVGGAVLALGAPVLAAVAILGGLTAAIVVAYQKSETFRSIVDAAFTAVGKVVDKALGAVMDVLTTLGEHFMAVAEEIVETLDSELIEPFRELWEEFGDEIMTTVRVQWEAIRAVFGLAFDAIVTLVRVQMEIIGSVLRGALEVFSNVIQLGLNLIQGDWGEAWDNVVAIVEAMKDAVLGVIGAMWDGVSGLVDAGVERVTGAFARMKDVLVGNSIVPDTMDLIVGQFGRLEPEVVPLVENMSAGVVGTVSSLRTETVQESEATVADVAASFGQLQGKIEDAIGPLPASVRSVFDEVRAAMDPDMLGGGIGTVGTIAKWAAFAVDFVGVMKDLWGDIKDIVGGIADAFKKPFGGSSGFSPGGRPPGGFGPGGTGGADWQLQGGQFVYTGTGGGGGGDTPAAIMEGSFLVARRLDQYLDAGGTLNANLVAIRDALRGSVAVLLNDISRLHGASLDRIAAGIDALQMAPAMGPQTQPAAALSSGGSGGIQVTNQFYGDFNGLNEADISRAVTDRTVEEVDRLIGQKTVTDRTFRGVL